jgi:hypothetical protein
MEPKTLIIEHDMMGMATGEEIDQLFLVVDQMYKSDYICCLSQKLEDTMRILIRLYGILTNPIVKPTVLVHQKDNMMEIIYYIANYLEAQPWDDRWAKEFRQVQTFVGEIDLLLQLIPD